MDHLAIRLLIQLGLLSEELFAVRCNGVQGSGLVIDEAIVDGETKDTKTIESAAMMYLAPDLELELTQTNGFFRQPERCTNPAPELSQSRVEAGCGESGPFGVQNRQGLNDIGGELPIVTADVLDPLRCARQRPRNPLRLTCAIRTHTSR